MDTCSIFIEDMRLHRVRTGSRTSLLHPGPLGGEEGWRDWREACDGRSFMQDLGRLCDNQNTKNRSLVTGQSSAACLHLCLVSGPEQPAYSRSQLTFFYKKLLSHWQFQFLGELEEMGGFTA